MTVKSQQKRNNRILKTLPFLGPPVAWESDPCFNAFKQCLGVSLLRVSLLFRVPGLATKDINDFSGLHRSGARTKLREDRMIIVFIGNPVPLTDTTTLPLSVGVPFGKLVSLDAANLKDSSEVRLDPLSDRFSRHIPKFANLGMQPTRLINKLLPLLVHRLFGRRCSVNFGLIDHPSHKSVLEFRDFTQLFPVQSRGLHAMRFTYTLLNGHGWGCIPLLFRAGGRFSLQPSLIPFDISLPLPTRHVMPLFTRGVRRTL